MSITVQLMQLATISNKRQGNVPIISGPVHSDLQSECIEYKDF